MNKIVILDAYVANDGDLSWAPFKQLGQLTVYEHTDAADVVTRLQGATAAIINKVVMTDEIMAQLPDLRYIGLLATGYNNVDTEAAHRRGIAVANVPAYSTESVTQTIFAHLLNIVNRVADHSRSVKRGDWQFCRDFSYRLCQFEELCGQTMAVYGLGNIGRVAGIANAFGMKVIALTSKLQEELPDYIVKVEHDDFFRLADVMVLCAPLTPSNRNFINSATLALMKPNAILINTALGPLVDEVALSDALDHGVIAAAGVDVLAQEPPVNGSPLIDNPHCEVTPHIAWESTAARRRLLDVTYRNLKAFLDGTRRIWCDTFPWKNVEECEYSLGKVLKTLDYSLGKM